MNLHALTTGRVKIKTRFYSGKGEGIFRKLNIFLDKNFTNKMPIHSYLIEHKEGNILIDTGETCDAVNPDFYPALNRAFISKNAKFFISEKTEIKNRLKIMGLKPEDIKWVVCTHLHQDHIGGLKYFKNSEILVSKKEYKAAHALLKNINGYMPRNLPEWLNPRLIEYNAEPLGSFKESFKLAEDVWLVPTEGHSNGHMSPVIKNNGYYYFFAGDSAFSEKNMMKLNVDGVCSNYRKARKTLINTKEFIKRYPTVYLPQHDPESSKRLAKNIITII